MSTPIAAEIFCICEGALQGNGALSIDRAYSRMAVPSLPIRLPRLIMALRLRFDLASEGSHSLALAVTTPEGQRWGPPGAPEFNVKAEGDDAYAWTNGVVEFPPITVAVAGDYHFELAIDGRAVARCVLCIVRSQLPSEVHAG
ncbi:MAG: hypothetical protein V4773_14930 [Verrucomicrobiota bacterium]